jgi:cytochrome c-type biogenesis protein CcmH
MTRLHNKRRNLTILTMIFFVAFIVTALPVAAQDENPRPLTSVTDDEVNAIARKMYCPICENLPLDQCGQPTCIDWREEIRIQLADGQSEDQIIAYFVSLEGDRIVGVPEENSLRVLTFIGPITLTLLAVAVGGWTFRRWYANRPLSESPAQREFDSSIASPNDEYRARLEHDLELRN